MEKYEEKLKELLDNKWDDSYLRLLCIYSHLVECKLKYEAYITATISQVHGINGVYGVEYLKQELFKELYDLSILMDLEQLATDDKIYFSRVEKFLSKMKLK